MSGDKKIGKFFGQENIKEYVRELRKNSPYSPEEERAAFERYKNGDINARNEIIMRNQRWIYSKAKEFARDEDEVMDYVSEGTIGLIEAIEKFDLSMNNKFITYASSYVQRAMCQYMLFERDMLNPCYKQLLYKKLEKIQNKFMMENGYKPSIPEIKDILEEEYGIKIDDEEYLYDMQIESINESIDDSLEVEESCKFNEYTAVQHESVEREDSDYYRELVMPILSKLKEPYQTMIKKLYHIGYDETYTIERICDEYNLFDKKELKKWENLILDEMRKEFEKLNRKAV